jgi:uncharacterized protein YjbI with pentapeptide repeats
VPNAILLNAILPNAVLPNAILPNAILPNAILPNVILPNAILPNAILPNARIPKYFRGTLLMQGDVLFVGTVTVFQMPFCQMTEVQKVHGQVLVKGCHDSLANAILPNDIWPKKPLGYTAGTSLVP